MLLTIDELRATLDRLESDGHTHLIAFWRTIPDAKDSIGIPDSVTHDQMLDIIDPGCGDFDAVHSAIDMTLDEAYANTAYYENSGDDDFDTDEDDLPQPGDDDFFVGDDDHA